MRKRSILLLLIFCLFLFFPTQKINGQLLFRSQRPEGPTDADIEQIFKLMLLPFALISDLATNRCALNWHPGDYFYEKNYKIIKPINKKIFECHDNCFKKMDLNVAMGSVRSNPKQQGVSYSECYSPCLTETMKSFPTSVATCKYEESDDYYTDGSYYKTKGGFEVIIIVPGKDNSDTSGLQKLFKNKHKLRDKYEKTEWQKARDECMEVTSQIKIKRSGTLQTQNERLFALYNDCLKERGY